MSAPGGIAPRRTAYRRAELLRLVSPRSVAIVGASGRAGSFGNRAMLNLGRFSGQTYLVNARYGQIGGQPCYPDLSALPAAPDCVFIAVGREAVEPTLEQCAALGVGGAVVVASGYGETGKADRLAAQDRLATIARDAGLRLAGPNTIGLVNYANGAGITFSPMPDPPAALPAHAIGVVSQSGSLGFALAQAMEGGAAVSHVLTSGNSCDVDVADYVAYLAEDPACRAIACVFEGMADPGRMLDAAERAWAADKPLILYKMATGEAGAAAALSHTGSLAGSDEAYRAAFARHGVVQVDRFDALVETAAFFAKAGRPAAPGVAVIATSGGTAIMAADKVGAHGLTLPQPGAEAAAVLAARIPEYGSPRNPCDVTAQVLNDADSLAACVDALLGDSAFGALVTSHQYAYDLALARIPVLSDAGRRHGKIVCSVWMTQWLGGPGAREMEADPHLALFRSMDGCLATLRAWLDRDARRRAPELDRTCRLVPAATAAEVAAILDGMADRVVPESDAKRLLARYGVPVVPEALVADPEAAAAAAAELGFPVVVKIDSPDIPHKTDAGVVRLGLGDAEAVRRATADILAAARALRPAPRIGGVLVQPMLRSGVEVMAGARIDPLFGPLIVVGLGGVLVEVLRDTAVAPAPVQPEEALAMLRSLQGAKLLDGHRGAPAVDAVRLAEVVARISELAADMAGRVAEIDVNPLICAGDSVVAVDGLLVRAASP